MNDESVESSEDKFMSRTWFNENFMSFNQFVRESWICRIRLQKMVAKFGTNNKLPVFKSNTEEIKMYIDEISSNMKKPSVKKQNILKIILTIVGSKPYRACTITNFKVN